MQQHGFFIEKQCCLTTNEVNNLNQRNKRMNPIWRQILEECITPNGWCDETENIFFIIATEEHGTTRTCREISQNAVAVNPPSHRLVIAITSSLYRSAVLLQINGVSAWQTILFTYNVTQQRGK